MSALSAILSKITGQFTATLILGYLLPVLLVASVAQPLLAPLLPISWAPYLSLYPLGWDAATVNKLSALAACTFLLYHLNFPVIRIYEGYTWEHSWLGEWCSNRHKRTCSRLSRDIERVGKLHALKDNQGPPDLLAFLGNQLQDLQLQREARYPEDCGQVLPTRLGNCIRAFEYRTLSLYDLDAVALMPRIATVASERSLDLISDAKTSFDFTLNLSFLFAIMALTAALAGIGFPPIVGTHATGIRWMVTFAGLVCVSVVLYRLSIERAAAWGVQVNAVFDLHRGELIDRLGYDSRTLAVTGEKRFWGIVSNRLIYPTNKYESSMSLKGIRPGIVCSPGALEIKVIRCVRKVGSNLEFEWNVRNADKEDASAVELFDDLPDGYALVPWTATASNGKGTLVQTDPITFRITDFSSNEEITIRFQIAAIKGDTPAAKS